MAYAKTKATLIESEDDKQKLTQIETTIKAYFAALDRREHGGKAQDKAFDDIQKIMGINSQTAKGHT